MIKLFCYIELNHIHEWHSSHNSAISQSSAIISHRSPVAKQHMRCYVNQNEALWMAHTDSHSSAYADLEYFSFSPDTPWHVPQLFLLFAYLSEMNWWTYIDICIYKYLHHVCVEYVTKCIIISPLQASLHADRPLWQSDNLYSTDRLPIYFNVRHFWGFKDQIT